MDGGNRLWRKDVRIGGAGDAQTLDNVPLGFVQGERAGLGAKRDALAKLAQFRLIEFLLELGLSGKDDLQQLFGGGLQVGEEPNFFEHLRGKALRFVNDEDSAFACLVAVQQSLIEFQQHLTLLAGFAGDAEVSHHEVKKLADAETRIEHKHGRDPFLV